MRCQKCGKKLRQNETFCTVCGFFNEPDEIFDEDYNEEENWETVKTNQKNKAIDDLNDDDSFEEYNEDEEIETDEEEFETDEENIEEYVNNDEIIDIVDEEELKKKEEKKIKQKKSKTKKQKQDPEEKEFFYEDEDILEAYIGEDYKVVKKMPFNIFAFLLSWAYVLYRKLYITGILGLFLTGLIIINFKKKLIVIFIYAIISMIFWGIFFNMYYIFIARKRVNYIKNKADDTDRFKIINICAKKGGVNFLRALIIYLIFLFVVIVMLFDIKLNKNRNLKFWNENSENKASCISLIKIANRDLISKENIGSIEEGTCKVTVGKKKEYSIYLKTNKNIYLYYKTDDGKLKYRNSTENIALYQEKEKENTLTDVEKQDLIEIQNIKYEHTSIHNKSLEEDKLIENKKNTSQKVNYYFTKEEITR